VRFFFWMVSRDSKVRATLLPIKLISSLRTSQSLLTAPSHRRKVVVPVISRAVPPAAKHVWTAHCAGHISEPCRYLPLLCRQKWPAPVLLYGNFLRRGLSAGRRPGGRAPFWCSAGSSAGRHFHAAAVHKYARQVSGVGQIWRRDGMADWQTDRQCFPT
jgi:hypothetical protein